MSLGKNRPATIARGFLRANVVRGPKKGTDEWYWRVRLRGSSDAGTDVWLGWGTRAEVLERILRLERDVEKEDDMAGGAKWKTPENEKTAGFIASVTRGPKSPVRGQPEWYWRVRERNKVRKQVWSGWASTSEIKAKLDRLEAENKETTVGLKVAIVSNMDHAKSVARALREAGHTGFPFPTVKGRIPPSMDVILCRDRSTSHGAFDICNEERRRGNRPVVIENGVRKAVDAINAIAAGTWEPPNLAPDVTEEVPVSETEEENKKVVMRGAVAEDIRTIVRKGGVFFPALLDRTPSQARDALENVPYSKKLRVVRTAVFQALTRLRSAPKAARSMVPEVFSELIDALLVKELVGTTEFKCQSIWWLDLEGNSVGEEILLVRSELSDKQLHALCEALSYEKKTYSVEEPVVAVHDPPTPMTAEADHFPEEPILAEPEPAPTPEPEPEPELNDSEEQEKDLLEFLVFAATQLSLMGLERVPDTVLSRAGLCIEDGSLAVSIIHLLAPGGAPCGGAGTRSSLSTAEVTCKECKSTAVFEYAAWLAEQGGNDA